MPYYGSDKRIARFPIDLCIVPKLITASAQVKTLYSHKVKVDTSPIVLTFERHLLAQKNTLFYPQSVKDGQAVRPGRVTV